MQPIVQTCLSIHELSNLPRRNGIQGSHFAHKKNSVTRTRQTHKKRPKIVGSKGLSPLVGSGAKPLFARPLARFLRQLRHFSRSRALARSLLSFLASSKSHPNGGKKRQHSRIVKLTPKAHPKRNGIQGPISPQNVSNQDLSNPRKTPKIAGFQRGSAPLAGFGAEPQKNFAYTMPLVGSGAKPRRGLGQSPNRILLKT